MNGGQPRKNVRTWAKPSRAYGPVYRCDLRTEMVACLWSHDRGSEVSQSRSTKSTKGGGKLILFLFS
jgi:hypothetical protein